MDNQQNFTISIPNILNLNEFKFYSSKARGIEDGGIYQKINTENNLPNELYLIKRMNIDNIVSEYVGAYFAHRIMGKFAPIVYLVKNEYNETLIASKFIDNFETVDFIKHGDAHNNNIGIVVHNNNINVALIDFSRSLSKYNKPIVYNKYDTKKEIEALKLITNVSKPEITYSLDKLFDKLKSCYIYNNYELEIRKNNIEKYLFLKNDQFKEKLESLTLKLSFDEKPIIGSDSSLDNSFMV